jgi:hypothetical protein
MHSKLLLGDEAQVKAHFGPFEDSANLDARQVHGLHRTYHRLRNYFGRTGWNSNLISVLFRDSVSVGGR